MGLAGVFADVIGWPLVCPWGDAPHPPGQSGGMPANVCWRSRSLFSLAVAVRTYELVPVPNWSRWADPKIREQKRRPNPKKPKKPKRLRNTSAKTPAKQQKNQKNQRFQRNAAFALDRLISLKSLLFLVFLGLAGVFANVFRRRFGFFAFFGFGRRFC